MLIWNTWRVHTVDGNNSIYIHKDFICFLPGPVSFFSTQLLSVIRIYFCFHSQLWCFYFCFQCHGLAHLLTGMVRKHFCFLKPTFTWLKNILWLDFCVNCGLTNAGHLFVVWFCSHHHYCHLCSCAAACADFGSCLHT